MLNTLKISLAILCISILTGCATGHHRMFSDSVDSSQISIIKGGPHETLHEVDGKPGPNFGGLLRPKMYNSSSDRIFHVELAPGSHVLKLFYLEVYGTNALANKEPKIMTIETEPGGIYLIESKFSGQKIDLKRVSKTRVYTEWDVGGTWTPIVRKIK